MNKPSNVIKGFEKLTPQQCFDMSAKHILKTRERCVDGSCCSYKGKGCAARPFLTNAAAGLFSGSWSYLAHRGDVPATNEELISRLQLCHDAARDGQVFIQDWKLRMRALAGDLNLSTALIDEDDKK